MARFEPHDLAIRGELRCLQSQQYPGPVLTFYGT